MSLDYYYDPEDRIIKAEMIGKFDIEKYAEIMKEIVSGKRFSPVTATVWDMRKFDFDYFDVEMAKALTKARSAFPERKGAIISYVVSDPVGYGMIRMFLVMTDTEETSDVFYDYQEALAWTIQMDRDVSSVHT